MNEHYSAGPYGPEEQPLVESLWPAGLAEGLHDRLTAASDTDSLISAADARTIAACLSSHLHADAHSPLRQYADRNQIDGPGIRAECLAIRGLGLPPQLRRWAAWLTTYAANALPPDAGGLAVPTNGDALDAFLDLPDVDPASDIVFEQFAQTYCGSYTDVDAVLDGITDVLAWERQINRLAHDLGIREFVSIDREAIEWHVRDGWDIIPSHGRLHVFAR